MLASPTSSNSPNRSVRTRRSATQNLTSAAISFGSAAAVSIVVWAVARVAGVNFETINPLIIGENTIGVPLMMITLIVVNVAALVAYAVLDRFMTDPSTVFRLGTLATGGASFMGPWSEAVEASTLATLWIMHTVATIAVVVSHTFRSVDEEVLRASRPAAAAI